VLTEQTPDGEVARATGVVRVLDKTLFAPASGRIAVVFAITTRDNSPHEPYGFEPRTNYEDVELCPFVLELDGGRGLVVIDSVFAELVDVQRQAIDARSEHWGAYCDAKGISGGRAVEGVVQPGHHVTIVGVVQRRTAAAGVESGFRETKSEIHLIGDFDHPLLIAPAS